MKRRKKNQIQWGNYWGWPIAMDQVYIKEKVIQPNYNKSNNEKSKAAKRFFERKKKFFFSCWMIQTRLRHTVPM